MAPERAHLSPRLDFEETVLRVSVYLPEATLTDQLLYGLRWQLIVAIRSGVEQQVIGHIQCGNSVGLN
jgi:hypothetical protein